MLSVSVDDAFTLVSWTTVDMSRSLLRGATLEGVCGERKPSTPFIPPNASTDAARTNLADIIVRLFILLFWRSSIIILKVIV